MALFMFILFFGKIVHFGNHKKFRQSTSLTKFTDRQNIFFENYCQTRKMLFWRNFQNYILPKEKSCRDCFKSLTPQCYENVFEEKNDLPIRSKLIFVFGIANVFKSFKSEQFWHRNPPNNAYMQIYPNWTAWNSI